MTSQNSRPLVASFSGLLFGLGLAISQMVNPAKILNFLDIAGHWDPTLVLVMGGALLITVPAFRFILKRPAPVLDGKFHLPTKQDIDIRLVGGAALFGVGWGLGGLCPGPAIVGTLSGFAGVLVFVAAMLAGSWLASRLN